MTGSRSCARVLLAAVLLAVPAVAASPAEAAAPTATGDLAPNLDFNGDGYADLAVGVPGEDAGASYAGGAVNVIYGSQTGLTASRNQVLTQNTRGVRGSSNNGDGFGSEVAGGDFNGDGRDDLVVGVPSEDVAGKEDAGSVHVLYGTRGGLRTAGDQLWSQNSTGVPSAARSYEEFGAALAAGRFNRDRYDDLAIGSPGETIAGERRAGSVTILYGSRTGLRSAGVVVLNQESGGKSLLDWRSQFGSALAVGDTNRDGYGELAVGAPGQALRKGGVLVFRGSRTGITTRGVQHWTQGAGGLPETAEERDDFGAALAFGDFDGNGHADLGIVASGESLGTCTTAEPEACEHGAVHVLYGRSGGLAASGNGFLHKTGGLPGEAAQGDFIGQSLISGDFNGDQFWELAIGSREVVAPHGRVYIVPGSATGLKPDATSSLARTTPGLPGDPTQEGSFGGKLAVGSYGGGTSHALAIGAGEDPILEVERAGRVVVLYPSSAGLTATGSQSWSQASPGIRGNPDEYDYFGSIGRY